MSAESWRYRLALVDRFWCFVYGIRGLWNGTIRDTIISSSMINEDAEPSPIGWQVTLYYDAKMQYQGGIAGPMKEDA